MSYKIYLASRSPRRKELLSLMGFDFEVLAADVDESCDEGLAPGEVCRELSRRKAEEIFRVLCAQGRSENALVIAADTLVFLDGKPLGKPKDAFDAEQMLTALSGTRHLVCTGISIKTADMSVSEFEETEVCFRELEIDEIRGYVATGEPMDKAGAYGIQGLGASLVEGINGDYFSVVGLPICRLSRILRERFDIKLF